MSSPARLRLLLLAVVTLGSASLATAAPAGAHPLGNATVNHYDGLRLSADRIDDTAVEDIAEIPTLQRKSLIDTNHDGTVDPSERAAYAGRQCAAMAGGTEISLNGQRLALRVQQADYTERAGVIQLTVGRLSCQLTSPADLNRQATLAVNSNWDSAGIGWHEITAVATGVRLDQSPFPASSVSDELRSYPNDMLSAPLNQRTGSVVVHPGSGNSTYAAAKNLPVAGAAVRALNRLSTSFNNLVGSKHLTVGIGVLAIVLAMLLGAGHAFLPGHGKTIMAAYLVGRRGRLRDVFLVGATVTVTHTAGVLVLGLIISVTAAFSTTAAEQDLGILSGLIIALVGFGLLVSALVRLRTQREQNAVAALTGALAGSGSEEQLLDPAHSGPAHSHEPHAHEPHAHEPHAHEPHSHEPHSHEPHGHEPHGHEPHALEPRADEPHGHEVPHQHGRGPHGHSHGPHGHSHGPGFSRGGLVGLGVAGGLVPSPSALLVLLAAIALGRTAFGITLVLSYGIGMAGALTAAGLLLVKVRDRLSRLASGRRLSAANRVMFLMPILTAGLVLVVGVGLTLRAAHGIV